MSKYITYVKQYGEGCDYTIGCGQTLWELEATCMDEAYIEVEKEVLNYSDENAIESAVIYEVSKSEKMPVEEWHERKKRLIIEQKQREKEAAERKEFERLQRKFSKGAV